MRIDRPSRRWPPGALHTLLPLLLPALLGLSASPLGAQTPVQVGPQPGPALGTQATPPVVEYAPASPPAVAGVPVPSADAPWSLRVGVGAVHDSNVPRTPQPQADRALEGSVGLRVDQRLGLQRLTLEAQGNALRYERTPAWDHTLASYQAVWAFGLTPWVSGALSAQQTQSRDLTQVDGVTPRIDLYTDREQAADLRIEPGGPWRVEGGAAQRRSRSSAPGALEANTRIHSARLGLGHRWASGLDLLAQVRRGQGRYPGETTPDFHDTQSDLVLHWPLRAAWTMDLRLGQLQRRHASESARDFEGAVGSARLAWALTARTRLEAGVERLLGAYEAGAGGVVHATRAYLAPAWQAGAHTRVSLRHEQWARAWSTVETTAVDAGRDDRTRSSVLVLDWQPRRTWQLLAQVQGEHRDSTASGARFRATVGSLTLRMHL